MDNRKIMQGATGLGYMFGSNGTIGRRITQNVGMGDAHSYQDLQSIGQQLTNLIQQAPSQVQPALQKVLSESSSYGPPQTVQGAISFWNRATGNGQYMDRDYALIAQAINDANAILQGAQPTGAVSSSQKVQAILSLGQQFQNALKAVPSSLTSQANAILAARTSAPANDVAGIIKFYTNAPSGSLYVDRDYAFMAQQLTALQNLLAAPPPAPLTPSYAGQVNTSGQPVYQPAPTVTPSIPTGTAITYGPTGIPSVLLSSVGQQTTPVLQAAYTQPVGPAVASTDPLGLPTIIQGVPTTYLAVGFLGLLFLLTRKKGA